MALCALCRFNGTFVVGGRNKRLGNWLGDVINRSMVVMVTASSYTPVHLFIAADTRTSALSTRDYITKQADS